MRILQLIDTLSLGGTEQTGVSFANELVEKQNFRDWCQLDLKVI